MSHPRKAHSLELIERRLADAEAAVVVEPMELVGLHDELARLERKWREQIAAGSDRRRPGDPARLDGWFDRLGRQVAAAVRQGEGTPTERAMLAGVAGTIAARPRAGT